MTNPSIEPTESTPSTPQAQMTYAKVTYADGDWCVCRPHEVRDMTVGCEGYTVAEVKMTEAEFEALPEFNG